MLHAPPDGAGGLAGVAGELAGALAGCGGDGHGDDDPRPSGTCVT